MCTCLFRCSVTILRSIFYYTDESTSQDQDRSLTATTVSPQSSCKSTSSYFYLVVCISTLYKSTSSHSLAFVS